ncbi:hypothetical protein N8D56_14370 [Devosia sp. A8/3-2]|nr:hypothetical protein N8D56_14370 [Devosia sp. A8/3-2]
MSLRDSLELIRMVRPEAGTAALEHEIAAERASSISAAERKVITALATLAETHSEPASADARRGRVGIFRPSRTHWLPPPQ